MPGWESSLDACRSVSSSDGARRRSAQGTRPAGTAGAGTAGAAAGTAACATAAAAGAVTGATARTTARTPGAAAGTPATAAAVAAAGTGAGASASTASRAAPRTAAGGTCRWRSGVRLPIRPGHPGLWSAAGRVGVVVGVGLPQMLCLGVDVRFVIVF